MRESMLFLAKLFFLGLIPVGSLSASNPPVSSSSFSSPLPQQPPPNSNRAVIVSTNIDGRRLVYGQKDTKTTKSRKQRLSIQQALSNTFLPIQYPNMPKYYLRFVYFNALQELSTQLRSVVATQRILQGVGVGSNLASAWSATIQFLIRDGTGMIATLLFAGRNFRFLQNFKKWRLFADCVNNMGLTLELLAVSVPKQFFVLLLCMGNVCKALCGVAAGACAGPLSMYWGPDLAETNTKFHSQRTLTGCVGIVMAWLFAKFLSHTTTRTLWILYAFLTFIHVWANMTLMRLVILEFMNTSRLEVVLQFWNTHQTVPSPEAVAKTESLFFWPRLRRQRVAFGVSANDFIERTSNLDAFNATQPYYIGKSNTTKNRKETVVVALDESCANRQQLRAYFEASQTANHSQWEAFEQACENAGWNLDQTTLQSHGYTVRFEPEVESSR